MNTRFPHHQAARAELVVWNTLGQLAGTGGVVELFYSFQIIFEDVSAPTPPLPTPRPPLPSLRSLLSRSLSLLPSISSPLSPLPSLPSPPPPTPLHLRDPAHEA